MIDIPGDLRRLLEDVRRTLACEPERSNVVDGADLGGFFNFVVSPACPEGKIFMVDNAGIDEALKPYGLRWTPHAQDSHIGVTYRDG